MPAAIQPPALGLFEACWHALVLGVVQGLTEFLPISSTAHLKVVPVLLGWGDPGVAVTAVIQLGSIGAVILYFRDDLAAVIRGISRAFRLGQWKDPSARLGLAMVIGTVPIVLAGLAIKVFWPGYETSALRGIASIGIVSIVMALVLALAETLGARRRSLPQVRPIDGVWVGLAQALALIPGVSRSGSTLTASLFDGWERSAAARFSFLLGIPAITLAGLVELKTAFAADAALGPVPMLVGIAAAAVVSWLAIAWLLRFLQNNSTWVFVAYRLGFGVFLLAWVARSGGAAG
ncbi:undecaprenyl-diphosphate phosphatase [Synechococcus sp. CS-1325]|uniref:undecaprenyl-diphosphate phosphatase n=1 Tax=unclassified Synechococcus TaxID=2626047 RepID=UPI000DB72083|nr:MULTISPECIES: undecaprenyl-diphosphate phosphatase [unclassified Synechococcus]PZU99023.1 MAG: undecaprenyl-diphosphatase [Cyanobium sp.]MCT0199932.1 undecaprenyl-diphosphate phosphatase [Synechococcus sp. CS-1325]MCT0212203.1 undecaprenyl-diphosphate phosphatase [Synechococcus sp. CS-1326]MCT0230468.1 undecaprenyl-diphosphate phosphatase [Synechococcus sp. CS-1324]MCT0233400.1 undecaprenyl-diphosphate phosphatase [Synechococcus sp. CS-1327]